MKWQNFSNLQKEMIAQRKQPMHKLIKQLKSSYPSAVIFALNNLGRFPEVDRYMAQCEKLDNYNETEWQSYSLFVHGCLLPTLERQ